MNDVAERSRIAPALEIDPFSNDYILSPYPHHAQLRDAGPVVWLEKWGAFAVGRHAQVRAVLEDHATFCSGAGVGLSNFHKEPPWRPPSLVLETDPPDHTRNRAVISRTLSPVALRSLREGFEKEADRLIGWLLASDIGFDAVKDLGEAFPLKVFGDAVGIQSEGRDHLLAYGNMVFNGMGPRNEHYAAAMANADAVNRWVWNACQRRALAPNGLGVQIYDAVDSKLLTDEQAATLVRSFLSAGIDTTANALGLAIHLFATHPEQWQALRADPSLARAAFEEVMRYESPFQTFFRTTNRDTEIEGVAIAANEKVMLSIGAANRDPRRWESPEVFDIGRTTAGHVGFGAGIHGCVGQMMARLEVEIVLRALASKVKTIEIIAEPRRMLHNTLRGFASLPVRLRA